MKREIAHTPISESYRIEVIDILRGFAVFGILVANMAHFSGQAPGPTAWIKPWDTITYALIRFLIEAKFYSLFSFLFGWGMAVQIIRAQDKGVSFLPYYLRRLLILLLIGLFHSTFLWIGDILILYAVLGFLLVLFRNRSPRFLVIAATAFLFFSIFLQLPIGISESIRNAVIEFGSSIRIDRYPETLYRNGTYLEVTRFRIQETANGFIYSFFSLGNVFGMFLIGLAAGKRRIFQHLEVNLPLIRRWMKLSLATGVVFNAIYLSTIFWQDRFPAEFWQTIRVGSRTIGAPALMMFYITAIILLYGQSKWRSRLVQLAPVGKMALSNYLFQSILATTIFYGYGLGYYGLISPATGLIITILIYMAQIRLSNWWMDHYRFGPAEWIWRTLSYGIPHPIRKTWAFEIEEKPPRSRLSRKSARITILSLSLAIIASWAVGLILWQRALQSDLIQPDQFYNLLPRSVISNPEQDTSPDQVAEEVIQSTLEASQVAYHPGEIAASGNLLAMASQVDVEHAYSQIQTLTAPLFSGRLAGSLGGWQAADYIANQFELFGLQPAGEGESYFQSFEVPHNPLASIPRLIIRTQNGEALEFKLHEDFNVRSRGYSGTGSIEGQVVWANYCERSDFDDVNIVDMVVLCRASSDVQADRNAIEHGAAGLMLLIDPETQLLDFAYPRFDSLVPRPLPTFYVSPAVVETVLMGSLYSLQDLRLLYETVPLSTDASLSVDHRGEEGCHARGCWGRNVLGVLPGWDSAVAEEIIILSAHYDHMGGAPDGTYWPGANDDASGVAALLEIARAWQDMGYVPRRTVLFAAWDAEEVGLLGSREYAQHPTYPIENIRAVLQLDMIGAGGEILRVDGWGGLEEQVITAAELFGIDTIRSEEGRSDHLPFLQLGIPATMLGWVDPDNNYVDYHRPVDVPENIDLLRYQQSINLANLVLLGLVEGGPSIEELISQRQQALMNNDLDAFLSTASDEIRIQDRLWFEDIQSLNPQRFDLEVEHLVIGGDSARGQVSIYLEYETDEARNLSGSLPIQFVHTPDGWKWAGIDLELFQETSEPGDEDPERSIEADVFIPIGVEGDIGRILISAGDYLQDVAEKLSLPLPTLARIELFENRNHLNLTIPPTERANNSIWISPSTVKLVYEDVIEDPARLEDALVLTLLMNADVTHETLPWLWEGLPLVLRTSEDPQQYQRTLLRDLFRAQQDESEASARTKAWASVAYIQIHDGWRGIGYLIRSFGRACPPTTCTSAEAREEGLTTILGRSSPELELDWKAYWFDRFRELRSSIDGLLSIRAQALSDRNKEAFLETVNQTIPHLKAEQEHFYEYVASLPEYEIEYEWEPQALLEGGAILADVTFEIRVSQNEQTLETSRTSSNVFFTPSDGNYLWSDGNFQAMDSRFVRLLYPETIEIYAEELLSTTESIYQFIRQNLPLSSFPRITIKVYDRQEDFLSSIWPIPNEDLRPGYWTNRDESIKYLESSLGSPSTALGYLSESILRNLLLQVGIEEEWLLRGMSLSLFPELDDGERANKAMRYLPRLPSRINNESLPSLLEMPRLDYPEEFVQNLSNAQAWDSVRFLDSYSGPEWLSEFLHTFEMASQPELVFEQVFQTEQIAYAETWRDSFMRAHLPAAAERIVHQFNPEFTLLHTRSLTSTEMEGRAPGSDGGGIAAEYIAKAFKDIGLIPIVPMYTTKEAGLLASDILVTEHDSDSEPALEDIEEYGYLQQFPIFMTQFERQPSIEIMDGNDVRLTLLKYREDFLTVPQVFEYRGPVKGELIWIQEVEYDTFDLEGKIVLKELNHDILSELEPAQASGAVGLILVSDGLRGKALLQKFALPTSETETLAFPVLLMSRQAFEETLLASGRTTDELLHGPPVNTLGIKASIDLPLSSPAMVLGANVMGLLPARDSQNNQETIIIGAHYDHVGDDPAWWECEPNERRIDTSLQTSNCNVVPGLKYPGINDNVSSVAILLEIARSLQEENFESTANILFVAWDAQEAGEVGSRFFVENPPIQLEQVLAVIQMDTILSGTGFYLEALATVDQDGLLLSRVAVLEKMVEARLSRVADTTDEVLNRTHAEREWYTLPEEDDIFQSDQLPFMELEIPSLVFRWRDAIEDNLPADFEEPIDIDRLEAVGRTIMLLLMSLSG